MTQPQKKTALPINVGRRFAPTDDAQRALYDRGRRVRNKLARRIERLRGLRASSRIEKLIAKAQESTYEAQSLATNSHEAKRYVAGLRRERRSAPR